MFKSLIVQALFTQSIFVAVVRHMLTAVGGALVAQGYVDATSWQTIAGGAVSLAGVLWSALNKKGNPATSSPS